MYTSFQLFLSAGIAPAIVRPLYAALPGYAQRGAFAPCTEKGARKFVLATNIAETSVTVPGILCLPPRYHLNESTKHSTVSWNNHLQEVISLLCCSAICFLRLSPMTNFVLLYARSTLRSGQWACQEAKISLQRGCRVSQVALYEIVCPCVLCVFIF